MSLRLPLILPVVVLVLLAATTAVTYAAQGGATPPAPATGQAPAPAADLVVPDVRRQAYVFAKGILEEAGFAWRVGGGVRGYAANEVVSQHPAPGTRLIDTGAPLVTLTLARNAGYAQDGEPEDAAPYAGTKILLAGTAAVRTPAAKAVTPPKTSAKPATPKPAAKPKAATRTYPQVRPAAFAAPGAPKEPLDEMPLADRARLLEAWVARHPKPTNASVDHWLFQHSWIVTGARFGWWRGAEALEILIRVDELAHRQWGVGAKSRLLAERALAEVRSKS
jgi:PASTA domain